MLSVGAVTGLGGLAGLARVGAQLYAEHKRQKAQEKHEQDLAFKNQLVEFQKELNEGNSTEVTTTTTWNLCPWKREFGFSRTVKTDGEVSNARQSRSFNISMLTFTLCFVTILFADNPERVVRTLDPSAEPTRFELLFLKFEFHRTVTQYLTTGGCAFIMVHAMLGLLSYWVVGAGLQQIRGRS